MHQRLFTLLLAVFATALGAQADSVTTRISSLGEWQTHHSYRFGTYVTESPESIIYTTGKAIFFLDKEDLSITRLAREDGLAEARIRLLRYHDPTETLIIVYESSTIDLLRDGQLSTLRAIDNFNFNGDKQIYEMFFADDNLVYLAAGFGVSALDLNNETFPLTTFTGVRVDGVAVFDDRLYAATEEGMYRAPLSGVNLTDFSNWELLGPANGFPDFYESTAVNICRDELYFSIDKDVYRLEADTAALFFDAQERDWRVQYIHPGPNLLLVGYRGLDGGSTRQLAVFNEEGEFLRRIFGACIIRSNYALEDDRGRLWFAEDNSTPRIRFLDDFRGEDCNELEYNGPWDDVNQRLIHDGTSLWVASGVLNENFGAAFNFSGVYRLTDGEWTNFNRRNQAIFRGRDEEIFLGDDDIASISDVHYDPVDDEYWLSSYFEGTVLFDPETGGGTIYDERNAPFDVDSGDTNRIRIAGAVSDERGNTYFANRNPVSGLFVSVRTSAGEWAALGEQCNLNDAYDITIDDNGYIWVVHAENNGGGLTVLDVADTPLDPSDDRCRTITTSNSELPSNGVRSIAVDLGNTSGTGAVWVGTDQGIVVFACGDDVFDAGTCSGRRPVATADDFGGFLLETEEIRSITVDGGNRKWIGTSGGAFLLSPDGEEQILFFDQGNSPLLDDVVRDIAIDPTNGEVYFGTELGIISYRSDATTATRRFREELVVFPNPVEPGHTGPIAISGLARDARVKITDLAGKLVAEGTATGGQFTWSGNDYNERRVTSGVYLIFASSNGRFGLNDPDSTVGKIVFLR